MQYTVDDDPQQFVFKARAHHLGIRPHRVQGDEDIAVERALRRIIKRDDVRVIIMP